MNSKVQGSHEVATLSRDNPPMISHIFLRWVKPFGLGSKQFKIVQNCCEQTKTILVPCVSYRMERLWWNILGWKHTPISSISKATNQPTCAEKSPEKKNPWWPQTSPPPKTCSQAARATPWRVAHGMAGKTRTRNDNPAKRLLFVAGLEVWNLIFFDIRFFWFGNDMKWANLGLRWILTWLTSLCRKCHLPIACFIFHLFLRRLQSCQFFSKKRETPLRRDYPDDFTCKNTCIFSVLLWPY